MSNPELDVTKAHRFFSYEALARSEKAAGNPELLAKYREEAMRLSKAVTNDEERKYLMGDLETLQ